MDNPDIESLLTTGSWRSSRSRSPNPYDSQRPWNFPSRRKPPPPPCVEDEEASLAKEHLGSTVSNTSNEEPRCRGEIDQQPLILPVHEYNPERRFVIIPGAAGEDEPKTAQARYEANTCRKYVLVSPEKPAEGSEGAKDEKQEDAPKEKVDQSKKKLDLPREKEKRELPREKLDPPREERRDLSKEKLDLPREKEKGQERPELSKRKSHQDLPRLNTEFEHPEPPIRRTDSRRERERPLVHQDQEDHRSSRDRSSARPPDSAFLSHESLD
ncbi:hypothetical protein N0V88_002329 [Collariella sp. IMI 366227]|nr:hypothetical protein N0V88_002329 [Collariella sp. IMI 366227]